jgi:hypothetical protein
VENIGPGKRAGSHGVSRIRSRYDAGSCAGPAARGAVLDAGRRGSSAAVVQGHRVRADRARRASRPASGAPAKDLGRGPRRLPADYVTALCAWICHRSSPAPGQISFFRPGLRSDRGRPGPATHWSDHAAAYPRPRPTGPVVRASPSRRWNLGPVERSATWRNPPR